MENRITSNIDANDDGILNRPLLVTVYQMPDRALIPNAARDFNLSYDDQTSSETQPAFCAMGTVIRWPDS